MTTAAATTPTSTNIYNNYPFKPATMSNNKNATSSTQSRRPVTFPPLPELYLPIEQSLDSILSKQSRTPSQVSSSSPTVTSHPFLDALKGFQNRTETWNGAAAYESTLSPMLDAFNGLSQATRPNEVAGLLDKCWQADPDGTMRIIWNLRSIHEGKAAKVTFYRAFAWLYGSHPKTAIANLHNLVDPLVRYTIKPKSRSDPLAAAGEDDMEIITHEEANDTKQTANEIEVGRSHGYWKDLLNILLLATNDELIPDSKLSCLHQRLVRSPKMGVKGVSSGTVPTDQKSPSEVRGEKYLQWQNRLVNKLKDDRNFRALYVRIVQLFADALSRDINILKEIADSKTTTERRLALSFELTLVGKWAPSPNASHDRMTNIATAISELLHSRGLLPSVSDIPSERPLSQENAHKLRIAYTQYVTSPLRRFLQIPEVAMSAQQWNKIKYHRVPSKCMQNSKAIFFKHDEDRFSQYLFDVARGKKKISGATLLPHELLKEAVKIHSSRKPYEQKITQMLTQVIDEQWRSLVARIREAGTLDNSIAVCDVSGSMGSFGSSYGSSVPIFPAVALTLLLSEIAQPPWAGKFITFSSVPQMISLDPTASLSVKATQMSRSKWEMNTDFNAIFTKLILPAAIEAKLKPEDMVKRLFVFSDMQFDDSRTSRDGAWETEHQIIKKAFNEAGYELPEIVYWNLQGNIAKPATKDEPGVAMLSGFSPNMLKAFLEEGQDEVVKTVVDDGMVSAADEETDEESDEEAPVIEEKKGLTPQENMLKILGHESFANLKVYD